MSPLLQELKLETGGGLFVRTLKLLNHQKPPEIAGEFVLSWTKRRKRVKWL